MNANGQSQPLSVAVRRDGRQILSDVSVTLERGALLAILGPNGSGKSTLLRALAGIPLDPGLRIERGSVRLPESSAAWIGPMPEATFPLRVDELVGLGLISPSAGSATNPRRRIEEALGQVDALNLTDRQFATLSGGEKQRVILARALSQKATYLLLDEAFAAMDVRYQAELGRLLTRLVREMGYGIAMVCHDLNFAAHWSTHVLLLREGKVISQGETSATLTQAAIDALYPGLVWTAGRHPVTGRIQVCF